MIRRIEEKCSQYNQKEANKEINKIKQQLQNLLSNTDIYENYIKGNHIHISEIQNLEDYSRIIPIDTQNKRRGEICQYIKQNLNYNRDKLSIYYFANRKTNERYYLYFLDISETERYFILSKEHSANVIKVGEYADTNWYII